MLETFGQIPGDGHIYLPAEAFQIRNNCQIGQFVQGDNLLGAKADIFICNFRQFFGDLGMTSNEYWNEIYFYPLSESFAPCVSQMFFKKTGRKIFNDLINSLLAQRINPVKGKFGCWFEKKQKALPDGSTGNYYHLNWSWECLETLPEEHRKIFDNLAMTVKGHYFSLPSDGNLILLPEKGEKRDKAIAQFLAKNQLSPGSQQQPLLTP